MAKGGKGKGKGQVVENGTDEADVLAAAVDTTKINGGDGDDYIIGGSQDDDIRAGDGDDIIFGGAGDDTVFGNGGTDTFLVSDLSSLSIEAGKGNSWIASSTDGTDTLKHVEIISDGTYSYTVGQNNGVFGLGTSGETDEDNAVNIDVFANAFDVEDDSFSVTAWDATSVSGATVTSNGDGTFTYDPGTVFQSLAVGESTTDSFSYTVTDAAGNETTSTVNVNIEGVNDAPISAGGTTTGEVAEDGVLSASGSVSATDVDASDTLSWSGSGSSDYGSFAIDADGNWSYSLDNDSEAVQSLGASETVSDEFTVTVSDGNGGTAEETIAVNITGADDGPVFPEPEDPEGVTILTDVGVLGSYGATSGWQSKSFTVDADGTYKIAFGSANWYDSALDINLWVDNVQVGDTSFGFEGPGGLNGWDTIGSVSTTTFTQTEGSSAAQIFSDGASEASMEAFLGNYDLPGETSVGAAMQTEVELSAGDTVSFDWRVDSTDYLPFDDYAFYIAEIA